MIPLYIYLVIICENVTVVKNIYFPWFCSKNKKELNRSHIYKIKNQPDIGSIGKQVKSTKGVNKQWTHQSYKIHCRLHSKLIPLSNAKGITPKYQKCA